MLRVLETLKGKREKAVVRGSQLEWGESGMVGIDWGGEANVVRINTEHVGLLCRIGNPYRDIWFSV